ncbi:MAG: RluA family pseudouridine synthase [Ferruginibacter sp.]|nr:RluA family pseudouridine synthase [Cytophagales bacterium]
MKLIVKETTTLLDFLLKATGAASKTKVRNLIGYGGVVVDGEVQKRPDTPVAAGQLVEVNRLVSPKQKATQKKANAPFPLLHEDRYLIAMEKPSGLLSIATDREKTKTFYKAVSQYVAEDSHGRTKIFIVHRLDREVSGVMVFAKSEEVKEDLQQSWPETEKKYLALVEGRPPQPEGTVENWLRENNAYQVYVCPEGTPDALYAITHYRVLKAYAEYSLLEVRIETGRKHQIRVHLADLGCPVVGDKKYGAHGSPIKRLGLHAHSLAFTHPVTGERIQLVAPPPAIFQHFGRHGPPAGPPE